MELKDLKSEYKGFVGKYALPDFEAVNEIFEIDRIERDTDHVLREVRKTMMDKVIGYVRFLEMMINPSQAPPMFSFFVKNVNDEDKKIIEKVYKGFIELELKSLRLEVDYSEKKEAEAIKMIFDAWEKVKKDLISCIEIMERNWKSDSVKKDKGYFG